MAKNQELPKKPDNKGNDTVLSKFGTMMSRILASVLNSVDLKGKNPEAKAEKPKEGK